MSRKNNTEVEIFIQTIRDSFVGSQQVYTNGSCYHFYLILKNVFSVAEPYYDGDHIVTKIGDKFYDITGEISKPSSASLYIDTPGYWLKNPFNIYVTKYE